MSEPNTVAMAESVEIPGASGLMRLPDGTVVTCRKTYTVRHEGEHALFVTDEDGATVEMTFVGVAQTEPESEPEPGLG
ncbi:hypothetical protein [Nocardioides sp.]|uniref:hypothetical protein n=1 Tax=Nocardioides sp. TaxID=35761 RepID=UPI002B8A5D12|nr:hypothetical protein [Nocardioides sp.]HSX66668.1 hypothetical protein [Nocardioides sp.]